MMRRDEIAGIPERITDEERYLNPEFERVDIATPGTTVPPRSHIIDVNSLGSSPSQEIEYVRALLHRSPLVTWVTEELTRVPPLPSRCCIYRVPARLRNTNENAYTPQIVSIGPLHHGKESLQTMEKIKWRYLQSFLHRTNMSLERVIKEIKAWEAKARDYYALSIELIISSDEFVKMMLVDGSFIIEIMLSFVSPILDNSSVYYTAHMFTDVRPDMILLENQLPFFVLKGLFDLAFDSRQPNVPSLLELSLAYFEDFMIMDGVPKISPVVEVKHFVDLLRLCHVQSRVRSFPLDSVKYVRTHNATELQEAGVKFEKGSSNSLLDIQYVSSELKIPFLKIQDMTETLLRNLIAFELCHYGICSYIIDYVFFMDNLIDTTKDVDLLAQNGVIENLLGDNSAVATLFNRLTTMVTMRENNFYYFRFLKS